MIFYKQAILFIVLICRPAFVTFQIAKASKVVIVGGGAVGVELAGEIKETYPEKDVTLIHSGEFLMRSSFGDNFSKTVKTRLDQLGVKVVLGNMKCNHPMHITV